MIEKSAQAITQMLDGYKVEPLDSLKEIVTGGNYLVFERFVPHATLPFSGVLHFTLYVARKSLKRGKEACYPQLDALLHRIMTQDRLACFVENVALTKVDTRLFVYAISLKIEGELDGTDGL